MDGKVNGYYIVGSNPFIPECFGVSLNEALRELL